MSMAPADSVPTTVGRIVGLWRYPVKSMGGEVLSRANVGETGIVGDRSFGVMDADTHKLLSAKRVPQLLSASAACRDDGEASISLPATGSGHVESLASDDSDIDERLSQWLGRPVQLRRPVAGERATVECETDLDDPSVLVEFPTPAGLFFDSRSVLHLVTEASLRSGQSLHRTGQWTTARFRPNILVETVDGTQGWVEDAWVATELHLGGVRTTVRKPCERCVITTRAQPGLDRDLDILKTLAAFHDSCLGIYLDVTGVGTVLVGDEVLQSS